MSNAGLDLKNEFSISYLFLYVRYKIAIFESGMELKREFCAQVQATDRRFSRSGHGVSRDPSVLDSLRPHLNQNPKIYYEIYTDGSGGVF